MMKKLFVFVFFLIPLIGWSQIYDRANLKSRFETGDVPTQQDFSDLIDSFHNLKEDGYPTPDTNSVIATKYDLSNYSSLNSNDTTENVTKIYNKVYLQSEYSSSNGMRGQINFLDVFNQKGLNIGIRHSSGDYAQFEFFNNDGVYFFKNGDQNGYFSKGIVYGRDYSAGFVDRSLVDKGYVDNKFASINLLDTVNFIATKYDLTQIEGGGGSGGVPLDSGNFWRTKSDFIIPSSRTVTLNGSLQFNNSGAGGFFTVAGSNTINLNTTGTGLFSSNVMTLTSSGNNAGMTIRRQGNGPLLIEKITNAGDFTIRNNSGSPSNMLITHNGGGDFNITRGGNSPGALFSISDNHTGNGNFTISKNNNGNLTISKTAGTGNLNITNGAATGNITINNSGRTTDSTAVNYGRMKTYVGQAIQTQSNNNIGLASAEYNLASGNWIVRKVSSGNLYMQSYQFQGAGTINIDAYGPESATQIEVSKDRMWLYNAYNVVRLGFGTNVNLRAQITYNNSLGDLAIRNPSDNGYAPLRLADPTVDSQAATKKYVDGYKTGSLTDGAPTVTELNSVIGVTASAAGAGHTYKVKDSNGSGLMYLVTSDGTHWHYISMTQAN